MTDRRQHIPMWKHVVVFIVSWVVEKNPSKQLYAFSPVMMSMTRVTVAAFTIAMLHQIWYAGIVGWPESTFCIALVLALPLMSAFDKLGAGSVVDVFKTLLGRVGIGGTNEIGSAYPEIVKRRAESSGPYEPTP